MIGELIDGKYKVEKMLGQGGMGSVYEATHAATGRRCAVKVINAEHLTKDPAVLSRFEREARAAGAIETQYITQVLDAGVDRDSGLPFLAMEFLKGEDLQQLSKRVGLISIVETRHFEYHGEKRGDLLMTKDKLLANGDRFETQIAADRADQARYR